MASIKIPPFLKKGSTIGLVCTSGFMLKESTNTCVETLQNWGFKVVLGTTIGTQHHYFSGTDDERLQDLQAMLDNSIVEAILCARGGYGLSKIIDRIDFKQFKKKPKWIVGFSDVTVLHAHLNTHLKIASLHAPMAAAFNDDGFKNEFVDGIRKALLHKKIQYNCLPHELNRVGVCTGELIGGNLCIIAHLVGSPSAYNSTKGKILFIEDVGEYLYNIDRMMLQLKRSGMLTNLAGLIVGGFTDCKDTTVPFGETVLDIINSHVKEYNYPVCFNFPVGHQTENYALKIGVQHHLKISTKKIALTEL